MFLTYSVDFYSLWTNRLCCANISNIHGCNIRRVSWLQSDDSCLARHSCHCSWIPASIGNPCCYRLFSIWWENVHAHFTAAFAVVKISFPSVALACLAVGMTMHPKTNLGDYCTNNTKGNSQKKLMIEAVSMKNLWLKQSVHGWVLFLGIKSDYDDYKQQQQKKWSRQVPWLWGNPKLDCWNKMKL